MNAHAEAWWANARAEWISRHMAVKAELATGWRMMPAGIGDEANARGR